MPVRASKPAKRQTRLDFSPLSSSSPAKGRYSDASQDGFANGRDEYSARRQSSIRKDDKGPVAALPTPEKSSQPRIEVKDGLSASSPLSDPPASPILAPEAARPALSPRSEVSPDSDVMSNDVISSARRTATHAPSNGHTSDIHMTENVSHATTPAESVEDDIPTPSAKRRRIQRRISDRRKAKATPRRSTRLNPAEQPSSSSITSNQRSVTVEIPSPALSILGSAETTGDEDSVIFTSPTARRRPQKPPSDNFVVGDDRVEYYSSEEELVTLSKSRRRAQGKSGNDFVADDDSVEYVSSDDDPVTPSKRPKLSRKQVSPQKERRREAELKEDLEDLADSDNVVRRNRTRGAPVNKAREETRKHLEILKRRRAGEKVPLVSDMQETNDGTMPSTEALAIHATTVSLLVKVLWIHQRIQIYLVKTFVVDEDDFVVDDSAEFSGIHPDIPLEFTSYASRKPRELFIHVIDWLVKNKLSPAFDRHDPLWELAFKKLDDEVKGQAGSRLISAAWNEPFVRTLKARPDLTAVRLPGDEEDYIRTCDACNRTNHPAQYDFQFFGKAYYQKTLEPVENSDDEDEDHEADVASLDSANHVLPPSHQHFYLGRYCASNAEMGHRLSHWLFHLNRNVLAYLEDQGVLSAERIISRDKKNHTKREREAEMIVDTMRETGVIDDLWRDFKSDMDDARIGMDGFEKKGGRGRARIGSIRVPRHDYESD